MTAAFLAAIEAEIESAFAIARRLRSGVDVPPTLSDVLDVDDLYAPLAPLGRLRALVRSAADPGSAVGHWNAMTTSDET